MSSTSEHHHQLTDGEGKCSIPMWKNGWPHGFCNKTAYGEPEPDQQRDGVWNNGKFNPSYCPGLACYDHGGPKEKQS